MLWKNPCFQSYSRLLCTTRNSESPLFVTTELSVWRPAFAGAGGAGTAPAPFAPLAPRAAGSSAVCGALPVPPCFPGIGHCREIAARRGRCEGLPLPRAAARSHGDGVLATAPAPAARPAAAAPLPAAPIPSAPLRAAGREGGRTEPRPRTGGHGAWERPLPRRQRARSGAGLGRQRGCAGAAGSPALP